MSAQLASSRCGIGGLETGSGVGEGVGAAAVAGWAAQRCQSLLGALGRGAGTEAAEGGQR